MSTHHDVDIGAAALATAWLHRCCLYRGAFGGRAAAGPPGETSNATAVGASVVGASSPTLGGQGLADPDPALQVALQLVR